MAKRNVGLVQDSVNGLETSNGINIAQVTGTPVDNQLVRYDGTGGSVQGSGVVVDDSGNVGIGTSSPLTKLHTQFATMTNGGISEVVLQARTDGSTTYSSSGLVGLTFNCRLDRSLFEANHMSSSSGVYGYNADTSNKYGRYMGLSFYTSSVDSLATEKMRIDSAGNVGIGVTPSAWVSSWKALELGGAGNSIYTAGQGTMRYGCNVFRDVTGYKYATSNAAVEYRQDNGGNHSWYTAPSGTAGNAITWNTAMTLASSGNLLVGTTTDNGVDKLQVNGSIKQATSYRKDMRFTTINTPQTTNISTNNCSAVHITVSNDYGGGCASGVYLIHINNNTISKITIAETFTNLLQVSVVSNTLYVNCGNTGGNASMIFDVVYN